MSFINYLLSIISI